MFRNLLPMLLLTSLCGGSILLSAQTVANDLPDPALEKQPEIILLSGISWEGSDNLYRTFFLSAERPFGVYHHAGLLFSSYLPRRNNYSYYNDPNLEKGGYEVGLFSKFFLHGRLTGRRSHLYYGPQMRFGQRRITYYDGYTNNGTTFNYRVSTTKFLFCLGGQYRLGHAALEWSLPIGLEYARTSAIGSIADSFVDTHLSTLPSISLGFRF